MAWQAFNNTTTFHTTNQRTPA
ncbi:hypothetical protein YPPY10_3412, partial [Yersinia pestis PY-10]